jgi:hypothetical protein
MKKPGRRSALERRGQPRGGKLLYSPPRRDSTRRPAPPCEHRAARSRPWPVAPDRVTCVKKPTE